MSDNLSSKNKPKSDCSITKVLAFGHMPTWAGGRQESGLANVIYNLALSMSESDGFDVTLAATDFFESKKVVNSLTVLGWQKKSLLIFAILHPFFTLKTLLHLIAARKKYQSFISIPGMLIKSIFLRKAINEIKPDVVHLHAAHSIVYLPAIPSCVKVILTHHGVVGYDSHINNSDVYAKLENDTCHTQRISKLYFISQKLISDFVERYHSIDVPYEAILDAYDSSRFHYIEQLPQKKLTLVTVASFSENKGQERVVEAIGRCGVDCRYICVGASSDGYHKKVQTIADNYKVDFEYVGKKTPSEIREILSMADYMILPSSTEGFGLVYLEAIACGVPVVLPKHLPIVQEDGIIQPGKNAILLENSSADAIVSCLPTLNETRMDHMAVSKTIVNFTWQNIGKSYTESVTALFRNKK